MRRVNLNPPLRRRLSRKRRAPNVSELTDAFASSKAMSDLADLPLTVAIHQQVSLRIQQHRTPHFLRPVVKVGNATKRRFDAAYNDRNILERLTCTLRVNND